MGARSLPTALLIGLLLGPVVAAATPPAGEPARSFPITFDRETIRLFVREDTLRVDGTYFLGCHRPGAHPAVLVYPYPEDDRLGPAWTVLLEGGPVGASPRPLPWQELPTRSAARWTIPRDLGPELAIRTVYEQVLYTTYARYIVTTTSAWGRPLQRAVFEIHLPPDATPTRFSFPFEKVTSDDGTWYRYAADDFLPDRDIEVEWR